MFLINVTSPVSFCLKRSVSGLLYWYWYQIISTKFFAWPVKGLEDLRETVLPNTKFSEQSRFIPLPLSNLFRLEQFKNFTILQLGSSLEADLISGGSNFKV